MEEHYFTCQCSDFNHLVRFNLSELDGDVYVDVRLNHYERWYKRIWIAVKYIFKKPHAYGHYDCTLLRVEDYPGLHDLMDRSKLLVKQAEDKRVAEWALTKAQEKPAKAE